MEARTVCSSVAAAYPKPRQRGASQTQARGGAHAANAQSQPLRRTEAAADGAFPRLGQRFRGAARAGLRRRPLSVAAALGARHAAAHGASARAARHSAGKARRVSRSRYSCGGCSCNGGPALERAADLSGTTYALRGVLVCGVAGGARLTALPLPTR